MGRLSALLAALVVMLTAGPVAAQPLAPHQAALEIDGAATAWILTSTALVLLMTLPGLALFYGGMVRHKNIISMVAQSAAAFAVVTTLWFVAGYSLSFAQGPGTANAVIGGLDALFLAGVTPQTT